MGVVNFLRSSFIHSCFERRTVPVHSTIYEGKDVFVCVSPQVVSRTRCREESVLLSASLPGWLAGSLKTSAVLVVSPLIALMVDRFKLLERD